jgi:2-polyprenyl-6-methoxyphenol hydroxylase-like FAD-dependent oxidoreductase
MSRMMKEGEQMDAEIADVVIVGAGPTGLMLASELRLRGVSVVVLERLTEPPGSAKALGLGGRALDTLDQRGLLAPFSAGLPELDIARHAHFGGILLGPRMAGRLRFLPLRQARLEQLLEAHARALGAEIRRGYEVTGLAQDEAGVTVYGPSPLRARYLVGCDGGHSAVRKLAGIGFPGTEPTALLRLGEVRLPAATAQQLDGGRLRLPFGFLVALDAGYVRITTKEDYPPGFDRTAPMTLAELQDSVQRTLGISLPMSEPRWLSRYTDASRQAERYRAGRVFLAGDAAHIHLPAGGPGINTGMQDAMNLGWKLAATLAGWAPDGLLDTYHSERHPAGRRVLMSTRAQAVLLGAGEPVAALRELFGELLQDDATLHRIGDLIQGFDNRYDMPGQPAHPLLGLPAPPLTVETAAGARRLAELLRPGRAVLITTQPELAAGWRDRLDVVTAQTTEPLWPLLVRPDGHVASVGNPDPRPALATWLGTPRAHEPQVALDQIS